MSEENNSPIPTNEQVFADALAAATYTPPEIDNNTEPVESQEASPEVETEAAPVIETAEEVSEDTPSPESENIELSDNIEEVMIKGKDGQKKAVKIDFSDRTKLKRMVQKAANAARLQSERDSLQAQLSKLNESDSALQNLQEIVNTGGFEGLIDHLNKEEGGFEGWFASKVERHQARQNASEEELRYLDSEDEKQSLKRRLDLMERKQQEREANLMAQSEQAERDRLASEISPIFYKYSFDGKLGDSVAEQRYNAAMFKQVSATLDQLQDEGVRITPSLIEKEFQVYTRPLMKSVNRKVRQNTKRVMDQKKAEATTHAQAQVRKNTVESKEDLMDSPNWIQNMGRLWAKGQL